MRIIFAPAVSLMSRLRYARKFAVLGLLVGVLTVVLLTALFINLNKDIRTGENELSGIQMLKPVNKLVQLTQQHRGLSSGVLNGNEAMKEKRAAKEKEVAAALQTTDAALSATIRALPQWRKIQEDWQAISRDGLSWTAPENIKRHTAVISQILTFMVDIADETELTLDPAMDTYYMMDTVVAKMPAMLERLGVSRARGTGVLTKKELSAQMRIDMTATLADMGATLDAQNSNIEKVIRYAPGVREAISPNAKTFSTESQKVFVLIREDILSERFATSPQEYFAVTSALIDLGYKTMYDILIPQFELQMQQRIQEARNNLLFDMGLVLLVTTLTFYLAVGMYYSVVNSINTLSAGARQLASGDLTVKFHFEGSDELHQTGDDFNAMANGFRQLLSRIKMDIQQLRQSSEGLASSSQQISDSASQQSDSASTMASSIEEMTVGVDHISKNAIDAQACSRQSDTVAANSSSIVREVVKEIQFIASTVNDSAAAVESLGHQSHKISNIVGTIKEIADQTNLLALNAAIEAARAGESGRGFAVVADEVRKLAERTTKSTQEITETITSIQSGTALAVSSMKSGVDRVATGVAQAEQAGESILQVQSSSQQVLTSVGEISDALREQSVASAEVARQIEQIAQMAEENTQVAASNALTAKDLQVLAERLEAGVVSFKT